MRLTQEALAEDPNTDTAKENFWVMIHDKLGQAGVEVVRSVSALRTRWWILTRKPIGERKEDHDNGAIEQSNGKLHSSDERDDDDYGDRRGVGVYSLRKHPRKRTGIINLSDINLDDSDCDNPTKRARVDPHNVASTLEAGNVSIHLSWYFFDIYAS